MTENGYEETDPLIDTRGDVEELKKELADEKAKGEANLAGWQRAQADLINYRRRCEQEMTEMRNFANGGLILSLLPVLDDFERAFNSPSGDSGNQESPWGEGIKLIERKLRNTLEVQGLSAIKAVGEPFDPRLHDAVRQDKGEEGIIVQEIEKGYKLRDKVLRPAKVIVGNGEDVLEAE